MFEDLKNIELLGENKILFITMTNNGYVDYTLNMLKSLKKIDLDQKILCVCIDNYSYDKLKDSYNAVVIDTKYDKFSRYHKDDFFEISKFKFFIVCELLKKGYNILFTDGDIFYKKNPINYIDNILKDKNIDVVIQNDDGNNNDNDHNYLCTGFYFVKSTPKNIELFNLSKYQDNKISCDQTLFNKFIKPNLNYAVLPLSLFPNGCTFYKCGNKDEQYLVHFNYVVGHEKKNKMINYGLWL